MVNKIDSSWKLCLRWEITGTRNRTGAQELPSMKANDIC